MGLRTAEILEPIDAFCVSPGMRLLHKALILSATSLAAAYGYARWMIPPTVFVLVTVEDSKGVPVPLRGGWGTPIYMDDGVLRPGLCIQGTDDVVSERRHKRIDRWAWRTPDGLDRAVFACRPGAEAAFACMSASGGSQEALLQLPEVSGLIPWWFRTVKLTLPHGPTEPLGELRATVLDADGAVSRNHGAIRLVSPKARLPLVFNFGPAFGGEVPCDDDSWQFGLPTGRYGLTIDHWIGITCGNLAPSLDRHINSEIAFQIEPSQLTHVTVERPKGTHLDLQLELVGDHGAFEAARASFLREWEAQTYISAELPPHRWRVAAKLQRVDPEGQGIAAARPYACRWKECRYIRARYQFPVAGYVEGLRQLEPGRYRLTVEGVGIEAFSVEIDLPNLDGGSFVYYSQVAPLPVIDPR